MFALVIWPDMVISTSYPQPAGEQESSTSGGARSAPIHNHPLPLLSFGCHVRDLRVLRRLI